MTPKQLELIEVLSQGFTGNKIHVINACIKNMDIPINVRCCSLRAATSNEAYLDMMRRTCKMFRQASIFDSFHPDDMHSGQAKLWVGHAGRIISGGGGSLVLRMWNGQDILRVRTENVLIDGWFITAFRPVEGPQAVLPDGYSDFRQYPHKQRIGLLPTA